MEASWEIQRELQAGTAGGQFPERDLDGVPFSAHRCSAGRDYSHSGEGSPL